MFKLGPAGILTVLHTFTVSDGIQSFAGVVRDSAGNLYGTTSYDGEYGGGTVYKLDPSGTFTVLHAFTGGVDGYYPVAGVILDNTGNVYGTTYKGGSDPSCSCGVVFKIAP